jgi:hypothetical protein
VASSQATRAATAQAASGCPVAKRKLVRAASACRTRCLAAIIMAEAAAVEPIKAPGVPAAWVAVAEAQAAAAPCLPPGRRIPAAVAEAWGGAGVVARQAAAASSKCWFF